MPISPFKSAVRKLNAEKRKWGLAMSQHTPRRVNRWFKWLAPGLFVKRWLLISSVGISLLILGLAIWVKLTPIYRIGGFVSQTIEKLSQFFPSYISAPFYFLGAYFLSFGVKVAR